MRAVYHPATASEWAKVYQDGGGFRGLQYQRGGGLGNIFSGIMKLVFPFLKSAGRSIGREALRAGAHIASDIVAGEDPKRAIKRHAKQGFANQMAKGASRLQGGKGLGKRPRKSIKGRPKTVRKRKTKKQTKDILGF